MSDEGFEPGPVEIALPVFVAVEDGLGESTGDEGVEAETDVGGGALIIETDVLGDTDERAPEDVVVVGRAEVKEVAVCDVVEDKGGLGDPEEVVPIALHELFRP